VQVAGGGYRAGSLTGLAGMEPSSSLNNSHQSLKVPVLTQKARKLLVVTLVFFYVAKWILSVSDISHNVYKIYMYCTLSVLRTVDVIGLSMIWLELVFQLTFTDVALP